MTGLKSELEEHHIVKQPQLHKLPYVGPIIYYNVKVVRDDYVFANIRYKNSVKVMVEML